MSAPPVITRRMAAMVVSSTPGNLGDDIQTLAQIDVMRRLGAEMDEPVLIDREELTEYAGADVCMLMNGWFMHDVTKFPPSMSIFPLFVGVHLDKSSLVETSAEYFRAFAPIGCRDFATVELFAAFGIDAYFSGCPTVAFERYDGEREGVYLVDVNSECSYIPALEDRVLRALPSALLASATELHHDLLEEEPLGVEARLERAAGLLDRYRRAELVITSRLHCALPCRAFGTPVIFLHRDYESDPRFSGLHHLLEGNDDGFEFVEAMREPLSYEVVGQQRTALLDDIGARLAELRLIDPHSGG